MNISAIVVCYSDKDKTRRCVKAIRDSDLAGLEYEIIVADNASPDKIGPEIKKEFPEIILVENKKNLGMGAGNNTGIEKSSGEFIFVLNSDTYVRTDTIKALHAYLRNNPDVGIAGPKLFYPNGQFQYTCYRFPKFFTFLLRRTFLGRFFKKYLSDFLMEDYDHSSIKEVDWIMGSCLMIRKSLGEKVGKFFDDRFWMYFEDTDLCKRAWKAGYKVIYYPEVSAVHDHGRGSASQPWYIAPFKNRLARAHIISWFKYFFKWGLG